VTHCVNARREAEVDGVRGIFEELFTTNTYALDRPASIDGSMCVHPFRNSALAASHMCHS